MKKNIPKILLLFLFSLVSCQPKPEKERIKPENFTIQNYKLDDDEIARRKAADTLQKEEDTLSKKELKIK